MSCLAAKPQPLLNEFRADPLSLVCRQDRHRRQCQCLDHTSPGDQRQSAQQNVADDHSANLGDQRQPNESTGTKTVYEIGFGIPAKRQPMDPVDGFVIGRSFKANNGSHNGHAVKTCRAILDPQAITRSSSLTELFCRDFSERGRGRGTGTMRCSLFYSYRSAEQAIRRVRGGGFLCHSGGRFSAVFRFPRKWEGGLLLNREATRRRTRRTFPPVPRGRG